MVFPLWKSVVSGIWVHVVHDGRLHFFVPGSNLEGMFEGRGIITPDSGHNRMSTSNSSLLLKCPNLDLVSMLASFGSLVNTNSGLGNPLMKPGRITSLNSSG